MQPVWPRSVQPPQEARGNAAPERSRVQKGLLHAAPGRQAAALPPVAGRPRGNSRVQERHGLWQLRRQCVSVKIIQI